MPEARLFEHRHMDEFNKATVRKIRRRGVDMAARCGEMEFSLYGEEGGHIVEGMTNVNYMGRPLDQTYNGCSVVWKNIMRARLVWGRLGTLLQREGADPRLSTIFYRDVVQAVQIFGSETWVLLAAMESKV